MLLSQPLFLIALVAVGLPIAVHLFNFRRYKKVYFSNVEYLEELQVETRRQSQLRQYLILAARILAIVFLVLAFAQPIIPNKKSPLKGGNSAVSVYIDNSFSMENMGQECALLEQARQKAREIAAAYQPSDQFQLLTNEAEGSQFRWVSRDEFLTMLDEVEPTAAAPMLSAMAERQQDFLHSHTAANHFAYVVSDFQSSTADLERYPSDSTILTTFVPLEAVGVDNLSIDSVSIATPVALAGSQVTALVEVANHGDKEIADLPVKLYVDGRERSLSTVTLPAHASESVPLSFTIDHSGILNCRLEIVDYPITFDDQFYFTLNVASQMSMLCVEGQPQPFVRRLFEGDSLVAFHACGDRAIDFTHIGDHQFIILNELPSIPSGLAQTMLTHVERGGSLLVVPAADGDIASYNQLLQALHAPLLGAYKKGTLKVSDVNTDAALYRGVFATKADADMERPTTQGHFKTTQDATTVVETAMGYPMGDIFLSTTTYGSGKVYLLTTPLRTDLTDFVQQALFVPTLYNMALYARPVGQIYTTIDNTNPVLLPTALPVAEGLWRLTGEASPFEVIPDLRTVAGCTYFYPHGQVKEAGHYGLAKGDGEPLCGLAFNYSRRESAMTFLTHRDVEQRLKDNHLTSCAVVRNTQKPLDQYIRAQHDAVPLWRWCIMLCLLMMAAEIVLIKSPVRKK